MNRRTIPRILTTIAIVTMVVSAIGFIASVLLNVFVFGKYDDDNNAYGEAPISGANGSVHLPPGDMTVYLHISGSGSDKAGSGLHFHIRMPEGAEVPMSDDHGSSTTDGNDAHVRIGHLNVPADGDYEISVDGDLSGYSKLALAFGHGNGYRIIPLAFAVAFGLAVVVLIIARVWAARVGHAPVNSQQPPPADFGFTPISSSGGYVSPQQAAPTVPNVPTQRAAPTAPKVPNVPAAPTVLNVPAAPTASPQQAAPFTDSDRSIRQQTLDTLARLRDSGALTDEEYEAETKRVLEGR